MVPPGVKYVEASIGRVITEQEFRKFGLGKSLMANAISKINDLYPETHIKISAQQYLEKLTAQVIVILRYRRTKILAIFKILLRF